MDRKSLINYVNFGGVLIYIRMAANAKIAYRGDHLLRSNIEELIESIQSLNLPVSINGSEDLSKLKEKFDERYEDSTEPLSEKDTKSLIHCMQILEAIVFAEIQERKAFFSIEKRYNTDFLYSNIEKIFGEDVFSKLPENASQDFAEAGKCIVMERGTAAAYHLMRGSEAVLKFMYECAIKRNRKDILTWGSMVSHLDDRGVLDHALKGTLDNFRRGFRNPVAHPDKFYSVDEAQDLLGTTTQLISLLVSHEKYAK